jgi:diketogulonate reductase-like aldo/keto reductase
MFAFRLLSILALTGARSAPFCVDTLGCFANDLTPRLIPGFKMMPLIGLGTAGLGQQRQDIVCSAVRDLGYQLIDTAEAREWYSESDVGDALDNCVADRSPKDVMIVTKIHPRSYRLEYANYL